MVSWLCTTGILQTIQSLMHSLILSDSRMKHKREYFSHGARDHGKVLAYPRNIQRPLRLALCASFLSHLSALCKAVRGGDTGRHFVGCGWSSILERVLWHRTSGLWLCGEVCGLLEGEVMCLVNSHMGVILRQPQSV